MFDVKKESRTLAAKLTLTEKVGQMLHSAAAVERLGIPAYNWWNEALHGVARAGTATVFPQAIALAAAFDAALVERVADAVSTEGRAKYHAQEAEGDRDIYKGLTFWAPNINIFRDPRWGRGHETFGEDPYLTAILGTAFIRGIQGADREHLKAAACAKHFAVHSGPENDRHHFNAECDDYDLWNTYLPAFEAAVKDAGVEVVMGAYNRTRGEPCCGSELLLVDILRKKWGFGGHVVSDCWAVKDFHESHHVTGSPVESVALAINKGCDLNCGNLFALAAPAVEKGLIDEGRIDEAVTRLFTTRMKLGLLGAPESAFAQTPYTVVDSPEHRALNQEAARRSLVLLKNDGTLPLNLNLNILTPSPVKTIAVIGPNADSRLALEGNYQGTASEHVTVLAGVRRIAEPLGIRVLYSEGCPLVKEQASGLGQKDDRFAEARIVAKAADAVILVVGLDSSIEGEEGDAYSSSTAGDKPGLSLPGRQEALLAQVYAAAKGKPVIVVNISGSAIALASADARANAVLQAFYPGAQGGLAIAEALFGAFSPSGKLPVTFYKSDADLPPFTDYAMANRTYRYYSGEVLYPFGFGLSYSTFTITDAAYDAAKNTVTVIVTNTGHFDASETVQVYAESKGAKERWALVGAAPIFLKAGKSAALTIPVNKNAFARYDAKGDLQKIPGPHTLHVGFTQPDQNSAARYGSTPERVCVECP